MARLTIENRPKYRQKFWVVCDCKVRFDIYIGNWLQRNTLIERFCYDNEDEANAKFKELHQDFTL